MMVRRKTAVTTESNNSHNVTTNLSFTIHYSSQLSVPQNMFDKIYQYVIGYLDDDNSTLSTKVAAQLLFRDNAGSSQS